MSRQTRRCKCPRCGGIFFTERKSKVYCNEPCRKAAEMARRWVRKKEGRGVQVPGS